MNFEPQSKFTLQEICELVKNSPRLTTNSRLRSRTQKARHLVEQLSERDEAIYGLNTGFGRLAKIKISEEELTELQVNLIRSHACGMGDPAAPSVVRKLLLLRMLSLGKTASGIQWSTFQRHLQYWNADLVPHIPEQGSVGASGDLAPLAHLALTFLGEGYFIEPSSMKRLSSKSILKKHRWAPLSIGPKEGLSLTNGTQFSTALALEAYERLAQLWPWIELAICLSAEGHSATAAVYHPRLHELKKHPEQAWLASRLYKKLSRSPHMSAHRDCDQVQDSYSFRCIPQVLGPCLKLMETAAELIENEANSVSDNPVFVRDSKELHSCGHFHAQSVSVAADLLSMAAVTIGNLSERRLDQLINPLTSRSTAFLAQQAGVESGLMIVQTAAAALASENKTLAFPGSCDSITTNGNQEDHVSMAPGAARKALRIIQNLQAIVACEILAGVRACVIESTRSGMAFSPYVEKNLAYLGKKIPDLYRYGDRIFSEDLSQLQDLMAQESPKEAKP